LSDLVLAQRPISGECKFDSLVISLTRNCFGDCLVFCLASSYNICGVSIKCSG
jgi:hypothetical protein